MLNKPAALCVITLAFTASSAYSQAKKVILFIGDGAGISSLNAASIYGYGKPQALYLQKMPHIGLADTSSAREWVTDAAACASAWATGHKGRNGVMSMSPDAERDVKDGEIYKTVMEYAQEQGLSTGIISNDSRTGVSGAAVSAFYAHINNRQKSGQIFEQLLHTKYGQGPDVVIGTGRKKISDEIKAMGGHDLTAEITARGYTYVDSLAAVSQMGGASNRVIALLDDEDFDINEAIQQAVARLSKNPKGFLLVAHSDCHLGKTAKSLQRIILLDQAIEKAAEQNKRDTLVLFTADHSYDLRIKGENLTETSKDSDHKKITLAVSLEDEHTAEEVPVLATGAGSERVHGFMSNTDVFHIMMAHFGWEK
jgi:alkaline phosphatase